MLSLILFWNIWWQKIMCLVLYFKFKIYKNHFWTMFNLRLLLKYLSILVWFFNLLNILLAKLTGTIQIFVIILLFISNYLTKLFWCKDFILLNLWDNFLKCDAFFNYFHNSVWGEKSFMDPLFYYYSSQWVFKCIQN